MMPRSSDWNSLNLWPFPDGRSLAGRLKIIWRIYHHRRIWIKISHLNKLFTVCGWFAKAAFAAVLNKYQLYTLRLITEDSKTPPYQFFFTHPLSTIRQHPDAFDMEGANIRMACSLFRQIWFSVHTLMRDMEIIRLPSENCTDKQG